MARALNRNQAPIYKGSEKTAVQKITLTLGGALILAGFAGAILPGAFGMHLSMTHNFVHIVSGAMALWFGSSTSSRAFAYCLVFGAFYAVVGIMGFLFGVPGYPTVGNMEADQNLVRIIPDILEMGTMDHILHFLIGTFLLFTAYTFRKERNPRMKKT